MWTHTFKTTFLGVRSVMTWIRNVKWRVDLLHNYTTLPWYKISIIPQLGVLKLITYHSITYVAWVLIYLKYLSTVHRIKMSKYISKDIHDDSKHISLMFRRLFPKLWSKLRQRNIATLLGRINDITFIFGYSMYVTLCHTFTNDGDKVCAT